MVEVRLWVWLTKSQVDSKERFLTAKISRVAYDETSWAD
jgi:hypothetical protein